MIGSMDIIPGSVLVIESHPMMREALCAAIADESDLQVSLQTANGTEALQMLTATLPDIILLSLGNPGLDELEALIALRKHLPDTPILALTTNEIAGQEQAALDAGACAVLTKAAPRSELISKLRELRTRGIRNYSEINLNKEANEKKSP